MPALTQIFDGIDADFLGIDPAFVVAKITADSREAAPGVAFLALRGGTFDGHDYIAAALLAGCPLVIAQRDAPAFAGPQVRVDNTQRAHGRIAANLCGGPAQQMHSLGVTGTNGKTSVAHLVSACLDSAQTPHARLGTTGNFVVDRVVPTAFTTPFPLQLQALLAQARDAGASALIMEVSSHALAQGRVDPICFRGVAMTSFSQDHLDFHSDMDAYLEAKLRLVDMHLDPTGLAVAAVDDNPAALTFLDRARALGAQTWALTRASTSASTPASRRASTPASTPASTQQPGHRTITATDLSLHAAGISFGFESPLGRVQIRSPLVGTFNVDNLMVAASLALHAGVPVAAIESGLASSVGAPGRLERVDPGTGPTVYVDYAHSPDAVTRALAALRPHTRGRLSIVLGCGGDRDTSKRPRMGEAASRGADRFYASSDNPRTEDPATIVAAMIAGAIPHAQGGAKIFEDLDRAAAIAKAIRDADDEDTVLIAGKGHEDYQILGTEKIAFDDRVHARAAIASRD